MCIRSWIKPLRTLVLLVRSSISCRKCMVRLSTMMREMRRCWTMVRKCLTPMNRKWSPWRDVFPLVAERECRFFRLFRRNTHVCHLGQSVTSGPWLEPWPLWFLWFLVYSITLWRCTLMTKNLAPSPFGRDDKGVKIFSELNQTS